jgi:NADPH-dependent curcumin reductase CurA
MNRGHGSRASINPGICPRAGTIPSVRAMSLTAVRQVRRPQGAPSAEDFEFVTHPVPSPGKEQVLVEAVYLSVDPYMRQLMDWDGWELGYGLEGRTIGRVIESRVPELPTGAIVFHRHGWSTHAVLDAVDVRRIDPAEGVPLSAYIGILGGTGLTAYVGLTRIAELQAGESLYVSAAAGGVGSAVGQIARLLGAARIIGSTGSAAKVKHLIENLGFDAAFNYHSGTLAEPIDVYFDNVGGVHLAQAIGQLRDHGRIAWCGAVGQYNSMDDPPPAPHNLFDVVGKSLRLEGFLVRDHLDARVDFERFLIPEIQSGRVVVDETVVAGFDNIVHAFVAMLRGENTGKMVVHNH